MNVHVPAQYLHAVNFARIRTFMVINVHLKASSLPSHKSEPTDHSRIERISLRETKTTKCFPHAPAPVQGNKPLKRGSCPVYTEGLVLLVS